MYDRDNSTLFGKPSSLHSRSRLKCSDFCESILPYESAINQPTQHFLKMFASNGTRSPSRYVVKFIVLPKNPESSIERIDSMQAILSVIASVILIE